MLLPGVLLIVAPLMVLSACQKTGDETRSRESRQVVLDGQSNFRDIGGYETSDGRVLKWGQVYRSGELHKLSDADLVVLEGRGIRAVARFLTDDEIAARGHDRLPAGTREVPLPIASGNAEELTRIASEARRTGDFFKLPPSANPDIHRVLVHEGREEYAALLSELADPANRPFVFHCSHGIHRTGTATAILLSTLGVPWETVRKDYLLSNEYRSDEIERRLQQLRTAAAGTLGIPEADVDMTNIRAFYILDGGYIDAAHDEILKEYGSVEEYVRTGLGLTEEETLQLRRELLD